MKAVFFTSLFLLCFRNTFFAQYQKTAEKEWPSAIDYELRGNVKAWVIERGDCSVVRELKFTTESDIKKFKLETVPTRFTLTYLPEKLKSEYEKRYENPTADSTTKLVFNDQMQLVEKQNDSIHETNQFSTDGKLFVHITTQTFSQLVVERKTRRYSESRYIFSYTKNFIMFCKYDQSGNLKQYEYYDSDPSRNMKMVCQYDEFNNLIEINKYRKINIPIAYIKEDYLDKFIHSDIDSSFSIDQFYPNYWSEGLPVKETFRYDDCNQKTEYVSYHGYLQAPNFKAIWSYDEKGLLVDEKHYDVFLDRNYNDVFYKEASCIIDFDSFGNVVSETEYDLLDKSKRIYFYEILYE